MNWDHADAEADDPTVCVAHGRFIPCRRKDSAHRYTSNPYWVKCVRDYLASTVSGLTWEPAWPTSAAVVVAVADEKVDP